MIVEYTIQQAVNAARMRTGAPDLGVSVKQGRYTIIRVKYAYNGNSTIVKVTEPMTFVECLDTLATIIV